MAFTKPDPRLPVDPSPLFAVGDRVDLGGGHYTFNGRGAHDPKYYCTCERVEGTHPRRDCGQAE